jgi:hypothetical protein
VTYRPEKAKSGAVAGVGHGIGKPGAASPQTRQAARTASTGFDASLGIYAKTASALGQKPGAGWAETGDGSGEVVRVEDKGRQVQPVVTFQIIRAERYALKSVVNRIMPKSRTSKCMRWRVPNQAVQVLNSPQYSRAFYSGLEVCASVWACPVCAAKITERRRVELVSAVATAKAKGWQVFLLTLTVPHGLGDDLSAILDRMMGAWRKTSSTRSGALIRAAIGLEGTVRAFEVTDGANGFHPHFHVLLFLSSNDTTDTVQTAFLGLWINACVKLGLPPPSARHGVRVDDGSFAAAYASKWGMESEMTKGHSKRGKNGSMTPWDMLRECLANQCERSRRRFVVYAEAFKGRRQLYWSNGLRDKLGVVEASDEQLATEQREDASLLAELTDAQWRAVLYTRSEAVLLQVAEDNPADLANFLIGVQVLADRTGISRKPPDVGQCSVPSLPAATADYPHVGPSRGPQCG